MGDKADLGTLFFRAALKWLGAEYKMRLGCGIILGLVLDGARHAVVATSVDSQIVAAFNAFGFHPTMAVGFLLAFAPLLGRRRVIGESYKRVFDVVDEIIEHADLGPAHRRIAYTSLLQKIQQEFSPEKPMPLIHIAEKVAQEVVDDSKKEKGRDAGD